jgi:hypothetical protein
MRPYVLVTLLTACLMSPLTGQDKKKDPKIDSLVVTVGMPRQDALDALVAAFQANRLQVTNTTSSMVEADLGKQAGTFNVFERKVRALILGSSGSMTKVMIVGDEIMYSDNANPSSYRIDSHAKSDGGKIWKKMVAVAENLAASAGSASAAAQRDQRPAPTQHPAQDAPRSATPSGTTAAAPQWRVDDVPPGTNWVADAKTKTYYRVGCPATTRIAAPDRLFYGNESSLQSAGFTKAQDC